MQKDTYIFRRIEKKYRLSSVLAQELLARISHRLIPDAYGKSTVCSLYLDTPDFRLIRASIDAKVYKEKLRLRSYGIPSQDSKVFLEIKKKFKGVVYKRRVSMHFHEAMAYIKQGVRPFDSQIMREIDYAMHYYQSPQPAALLCYERQAYFVKDLPALRLTFDSGVRYRQTDLTPAGGTSGKLILPDDTLLLEIKTDGAMPLWLSHALDCCGIFPSSFSKYGTAYLDICQNQTQELSFPQKGATIHV